MKEKRALKQEKREARKQAAADARNGVTSEGALAEDATEESLDADLAEESLAADRPVEPIVSELSQAEERRRRLG